MITNTVEVAGTLQADGKLILDERPALPPGRVRVALQLLAENPPGIERLPDAPWTDDSVPATCDLPHEGTVVPIQPRVIAERLPDFLAGLTEASQ
jgi:hypothetical protein